MKRLVSMLLAAACIVAAVPAQVTAAEGDSAELRVRVIHASNNSKKYDPQLEDLRKFLEPHKFSSFKQVIDETVTIDEKQTKGLGLLSGKTLNVTLDQLTAKDAKVRLLLLGPTGMILDTTVKAGPHKLFFIAGPKYEGGILFIAIEPHYDPDKVGKNVGSNDDGKKPN